MKIGNILGNISPAYSMATGNGFLDDFMGTLSPLYGLTAKKGVFDGDVDPEKGDLGINGFLASLFMNAMGH